MDWIGNSNFMLKNLYFPIFVSALDIYQTEHAILAIMCLTGALNAKLFTRKVSILLSVKSIQ